MVKIEMHLLLLENLKTFCLENQTERVKRESNGTISKSTALQRLLELHKEDHR